MTVTHPSPSQTQSQLPGLPKFVPVRPRHTPPGGSMGLVLSDLVAPPGLEHDWRSRGLCLDRDAYPDMDMWFPVGDSGPAAAQAQAAKAACSRCPVRQQCRKWAIAALPYGIAGGLDAEERKQLRQRGVRV